MDHVWEYKGGILHYVVRLYFSVPWYDFFFCLSFIL